MRQDKGLSGDLDRLPMLTGLMVATFLDNMAQLRADEALPAGDCSRAVGADPRAAPTEPCA